jgi:hypothetical protein
MADPKWWTPICEIENGCSSKTYSVHRDFDARRDTAFPPPTGPFPVTNGNGGKSNIRGRQTTTVISFSESNYQEASYPSRSKKNESLGDKHDSKESKTKLSGRRFLLRVECELWDLRKFCSSTEPYLSLV